MNGIDEAFCTGDASDREKFLKWAKTVPATIGNPLYHWTHLEMARYFHIFDLLTPDSALAIYEAASSLLKKEEYSTQGLLQMMNVEVVCTTDDPTDSLEYHMTMRASGKIKALPAWRPDNILKTDDAATFATYLYKLSESSGIEIKSFASMIEALEVRHHYFHKNGVKLADHGLERFYFSKYDSSSIEAIFQKLIKGNNLSADENEMYKTATMTELCRMNHRRNWTQQFHIGAIRNNNQRMFAKLGADTGWDSIGSTQDACTMAKFLNSLDVTNQLAKTILYNLHPADNEMMITMAGNFNDGSYPAKVQYGAAWWFLDQKNGMEKHLRDLSSLSLLSKFVGMVTDSRSFLSYPRHEYFRRLLCNYIGDEVEKGLIPNDPEILKPLIEGIVYYNAKEYFDL